MIRAIRQLVPAALCAAAFVLPLSSCARPKEPAPTSHKVEYTVRAEIMRLPAPGEPAPELQARHEEIPSFVEKHGEAPKGMRAMTMPFPVAPSLDLSAISVGDKVSLTFEVDYAIETGLVDSWRATRIVALPPETVLDFGAAAPKAD